MTEIVVSIPSVIVNDRFESKFTRSEGYWVWTGQTMTAGYGKFGIGSKRHAAHRLAYQFVYGDVPPGIYVCHKCDNKLCVRPGHLFAGTPADNTSDMWNKGRGIAPSASLPGESNPQAKLTQRDVDLIRMLVREGSKQAVLAKVFGVTFQTISDIVRGKRWNKRAESND